MPKSQPTPAKSTTPPGLERDKVVRAAIELLDEAGFDKVTLRRVADKLGVKAAALYWHFKNKQDLVDAMAMRVLYEHHHGRPHVKHEPWQDLLRQIGHMQRRALLAHRDGARLVASANMARMPLMEGMERLLHALAKQGFAPEFALLSVINISRYTLGCVFEEQADPLTKSEALALRKQMVEQSAERFPNAYQAISAFASSRSLGPKAQYDHGLELIISGIEHRLQHPKA